MDKPTDQSATEPLVGAQTPLQHTSDEALSIPGLMRIARAGAWDECAREAYDRGWTHDHGRDDLLGRNPYWVSR